MDLSAAERLTGARLSEGSALDACDAVEAPPDVRGRAETEDLLDVPTLGRLTSAQSSEGSLDASDVSDTLTNQGKGALVNLIDTPTMSSPRSSIDSGLDACGALDAALAEQDRTEGGIPPYVWVWWEQGWDEAPPAVQLCAQSWIDNHPGVQVRLLDKALLAEVMPELTEHKPLWACPAPVARSDFVRAKLLATYGGLWADATLMCTGDVFAWLDSIGVDDFFVYTRKGSASWPVDPFKDRSLAYSSWFIAASRNSAVAAAVAEVLTSRLAACFVAGEPPDYFWIHQSIERVAGAAGTAAAAALAKMPVIESRAPHLLEFETGFMQIATDESCAALDCALRTTPMQKLSYKALAPKLMAALADADGGQALWSTNLGNLLVRAGQGIVKSTRALLENVPREELQGATLAQLADFEMARKQELWANWPKPSIW